MNLVIVAKCIIHTSSGTIQTGGGYLYNYMFVYIHIKMYDSAAVVGWPIRVGVVFLYI